MLIEIQDPKNSSTPRTIKDQPNVTSIYNTNVRMREESKTLKEKKDVVRHSGLVSEVESSLNTLKSFSAPKNPLKFAHNSLSRPQNPQI